MTLNVLLFRVIKAKMTIESSPFGVIESFLIEEVREHKLENIYIYIYGQYFILLASRAV